jgi:hypothetical protein
MPIFAKSFPKENAQKKKFDGKIFDCEGACLFVSILILAGA